MEQIPALLIDRIEVVKGGASALYGPGAVAGVVNIIPRRIGETGACGIVGHESVKGQHYYLASGAVTYGFGANGSGVTAYGYYENAAPVDYNGDGYTEPVDRTLAIGGARARLALGSRSTLALDYQYTAEDRRAAATGSTIPNFSPISPKRSAPAFIAAAPASNDESATISI